MKVVLLQDWLTGFRGGERVLDAICELFPDAPLYTLIHIPGSTSKLIDQRKITQSFLGKIPGVQKHYRKLLPVFPLAASSLKITEQADLVISTSHCVIKGVKKPPGAKHISYVHSPMRYIYDQFPLYFGKEAPLIQRLGAHLCRPFLRRWDIDSNQNVDQMIANSGFVKDRIEYYYGEESKVIHPFVDLADFDFSKNHTREDFYLMVSAFAPNKKVGLAIEAFNKMGKVLKIVGGGQQEDYLRSIAKNNIEFLGNRTREEVVELYQKTRGFIFPGIEDFGITPLEAMAGGSPIVAFRAGGVLETLTDKTAEFFGEQSAEALCQAVERFEKRTFHQEDLIQRAQSFSKEKFKREFLAECERLVQ